MGPSDAHRVSVCVCVHACVCLHWESLFMWGQREREEEEKKACDWIICVTLSVCARIRTCMLSKLLGDGPT